MGLLEQFRAGTSTPPGYEQLGYLRNPFPARGQVDDEVFAERPELQELDAELLSYIRGHGAGRIYALAGDSGVGKSNYLRHVQWFFQQIAAERPELAWYYMGNQQASSRALVMGVLNALGSDRIDRLLNSNRSGEVEIPSHVVASDLGRFFERVRTLNADGLSSARAFLVRWVGGEQTYSGERSAYGVQAKDRLAPAVSLSYLRTIADLLDASGAGVRLVLLLDEFEDVQAAQPRMQTDYLMAIKGLVNTFNLEKVFLIIAGQDAAFSSFELRVPSLQTRWKRARLSMLSASSQAVELARVYKEQRHQEYISAHPQQSRRPYERLEPGDDTVKARFTELVERSHTGRKEIKQRDLLEVLYQWVEERLRAASPARPG